jgi:hypothetical protein
MVTRQAFLLTLMLVTAVMAATGCTFQPLNALTGPSGPRACSEPPAAIDFLGWTTATVPPGSVTLTWDAAPGVVTRYVVELGTTRGAANLGVVEVSGTARSHTFHGLAAGDYFARVRAKNECGVSAPSNDANPRVR